MKEVKVASYDYGKLKILEIVRGIKINWKKSKRFDLYS